MAYFKLKRTRPYRVILPGSKQIVEFVKNKVYQVDIPRDVSYLQGQKEYFEEVTKEGNTLVETSATEKIMKTSRSYMSLASLKPGYVKPMSDEVKRALLTKGPHLPKSRRQPIAKELPPAPVVSGIRKSRVKSSNLVNPDNAKK